MQKTLTLVNAHGFHAVPALGVALLTDVPFVFTPHFHGVGHTAMARRLHKIYDPLAIRTVARSRRIICVSEAEAAAFGEMFPSAAERIRIVPNGVDAAGILGAERYSCSRRLVLSVGRLEEYKQVDLLVKAASHLPSDTCVAIIGDGSERLRLEALVKERGLSERVVFLGNVDGGRLKRCQRTAAITVSLSRHEAFGLILGEAAVAGSRILASDISAHREVGRMLGADVVSLISPAAEEREVAERIRHALERAAPVLPQITIRNLGWDVVCRRTADVFREALDS